MAKTKISEFNANPALNTDIDSINIAEGCAPSGINDAIRELMSQLKDWQAGTSNDPMVIGSSGSLTLNQGTANGVAYLNGSKVVTSGSALSFDGTSLNVGSATFPDGRVRVKQASDASKQKGLLIEAAADDSLLAIGYDGSAFTFNPTYNTTGGYKPMAWWVSGSEQMRLTSTGLGIGTSSPANKLSVNSGASTTTAQFTSTGSSVFLGLTNSGSSAFIGADSTGSFLVQTSGSGYATKLTVDSAGNLGLGVTPSAWSLSGLSAMQIRNGSIYGYTNNEIGISANAYYNSGWKYIASATASQYIQTGGVHQWFNAPSGTAGNAISFTQAMTLDASGNLLINATSASVADAGADNLVVGPGSGNNGITIYSSNTGNCNLNFADTDASTVGFIQYQHAGNNMNFRTNSSEAMRIDSSGNLLVGTTNTSPSAGAGFKIQPTGKVYAVSADSTNSSECYGMYSTGAANYRFYVGWGGTVYATSTTITGISDQRLKENIRDLDDGLASVMALQPRKFDWKEGKGAGTKNARGFIAQEFETVFPDMIEEWLDPAPEGEEAYKAINANLIPTLVKAIQELKAEFDAYKATHP